MNIEIWSDYACPFCFIGKHRLEQALKNLSIDEEISIEFKSFQLDPQAPLYKGEDYYESLAKKFGGIEQAKQMTANVEKFAKTVNLQLNFDKVKSTNTYLAHRLAKYALEYDQNLTIAERLFQAHFINGEDISDVNTLKQIAEDVGLDGKETVSILENEKAYRAEVEHDLNEAKQFNITGVPFFVFNRKLALSGAQDVEIFVQALQQVLEDS